MGNGKHARQKKNKKTLSGGMSRKRMRRLGSILGSQEQKKVNPKTLGKGKIFPGGEVKRGKDQTTPLGKIV